MQINLINLKVLLTSVSSLFILFISVNSCKAQSNETDTVYVLFSEESGNDVRRAIHHNIDSTSLYPKDFDRTYTIPKKDKGFNKEIMFNYSPIYPPWMDTLYYSFEPVSILNEKDFKDQEWFEKTDYDKIVGTFSDKDKVILLAEKNKIRNDTLCLIKVSFHYPVEE